MGVGNLLQKLGSASLCSVGEGSEYLLPAWCNGLKSKSQRKNWSESDETQGPRGSKLPEALLGPCSQCKACGPLQTKDRRYHTCSPIVEEEAESQGTHPLTAGAQW